MPKHLCSLKMKKTSGYYIGLMSGTSLDGVDAAIIQTAPTIKMIGAIAHDFPVALRQKLADLCSSGENEIERMGLADVALGHFYADCVNSLLEKYAIAANSVCAIGCHGQTIRHRPGQNGFSLQIGNADILSSKTSISVVNNFRNKDMALGGQGAPLVPAFHAAAFGQENTTRVIINIGGMANISVLNGAKINNGYDTGPGNILLDSWHMQHQKAPYDQDGNWGAKGSINNALLSALLDDEYFSRLPPKSTGREHFNSAWLEQHLRGDEKPVDVQATLVELTAMSIAAEVLKHHPDDVFVCGGGFRNTFLMTRLQAHLGNLKCQGTDALGIHPDWVEACAFAWLACARINQISGNAPAVTGAEKEAVLGAVYLPN